MWKRSLLRGSRAIVGTTVGPHCKDLVLRTIVSTVASVPADPSQQKKRERYRDRGHNPLWFQQIGLQLSPRHGCDRSIVPDQGSRLSSSQSPHCRRHWYHTRCRDCDCDRIACSTVGTRSLHCSLYNDPKTWQGWRSNPFRNYNYQMIRTDSSQASNPLRSNPDPKPNQAGSSNGRPKRNQVARTAAANNNKNNNNSNNNNNNNNGMSKEECSRILERACSEIRGIVLTKRQRSKPWIMALLLHRYDRGIRDPHELHTDSVYWKRNNTNNHDSGDSRSSNHTHTRTHAAAAAAVPAAHSKWVAPDGIDLREVMTPHPQHVRGFLDENNPNSSSSSSSSSESENKSSYETEVVELLRREKLALLATEARRIVVDRKLKLPNTSNTKNIINNNNNNKPNGKTLRTPTTTTTERDARKLSKKDPALFLSLVAMALANAERNKGKSKNDTPEDFSHRRHHPPSLKTAVYHKAKLREKHRKAAAQKATAAGKTNGNHQKRRYPAEVRNKLAAMRQTR